MTTTTVVSPTGSCVATPSTPNVTGWKRICNTMLRHYARRFWLFVKRLVWWQPPDQYLYNTWPRWTGNRWEVWTGTRWKTVDPPPLVYDALTGAYRKVR